MKNYLQKPLFKKILLYLIGLILLLVVLDNIILPWYVSSPETVVPNVIGKTEADAIHLIQEASLEGVVADTTFDENYPKGTILFQRPKAGAVVKEDRNIYLFVSGGEPVVTVPALKGKSVRDAKFTLERIGLELGEVQQLNSENPKGMIFDQQFAAGTPIKKGQSIGVSVSIGQSGEGEIIVPDLIGKSLTEAEKILADSSLNVGKINYQRSFSLLPNTILDQYPSKGNKLSSGGVVDLFVTKSASSDDNEIPEE